MTTRNDEMKPQVYGALAFLVNASRVDPVLRAKVKIVEDEVDRLREALAEAEYELRQARGEVTQ